MDEHTRAQVRVDNPEFVDGSCDGAHTDPRCPVHGVAPWPHAQKVCTGRRYWGCPGCLAWASGSYCLNCGRGAPLSIYDPAAEYPEDLLRERGVHRRTSKPM